MEKSLKLGTRLDPFLYPGILQVPGREEVLHATNEFREGVDGYSYFLF
jgi:hypothetical protein